MKKIIAIVMICALSQFAFSQNFGIGQPNPTQKLDVNGNIKMDGNTFIGAGSNSSYGAFTVQGERNGWGGLSFRRANGAMLGTLMMHEDYSGVYNNSDNNWDWYWVNGTLATGTVPFGNVSGSIPLSRVYADAGGGYMHLGAWDGAWNLNNGVLVQGARYGWGWVSDRKLKTNIVSIQNSELKILSDKLLNTRLYHYHFADDPSGNNELKYIGMMADEAPEEMQMQGQHGIKIGDTFAMMLAAIKVLKQENNALKERLSQIEKQIEK